MVQGWYCSRYRMHNDRGGKVATIEESLSPSSSSNRSPSTIYTSYKGHLQPCPQQLPHRVFSVQLPTQCVQPSTLSLPLFQVTQKNPPSKGLFGNEGIERIGGAKIPLIFNFEQQVDFSPSNFLHFPLLLNMY